MTINQIIVHKIDRPPDSESLQAIPAKKSLSSTNSLEIMLDDLLRSYNGKQDKCYGQFSDVTANSFAYLLADYLKLELDKQGGEFTQLTTNLLDRLQKGFNKAGALGGGYILIADYQLGLNRYLIITMVSCQNSVTVTNHLTIEESSYLDTGKMSLACRINLTEWGNNPEASRYLSYLRPKGGKRLSQVFQDAIGCTETSSSKEEADTLVKAVTDYCKEETSDQNKTMVKRQVYDYCQNKLNDGGSLSIGELSGYLSEAGPDNFARFVNTRDYDVSAPMMPERRTLARLVRYTGRSKGLSLAFDAELLGQQIRYDNINDQLIIKGVPENLKEQLKEVHEKV